MMKYIAIIILFAALTAASKAQFVSNTAGLKVIKSDADELVVSYKPDLQGFRSITLDGGTSAWLPDISGCEPAALKQGSPSILINNQIFAVPDVNGIESFDYKINGIEYYDKLMAPAPQLVESKEMANESYIVNIESYKNAQLRPWALYEYKGFSRYYHLSNLKIVAAQYDASNNSIAVAKEIIVTIKFKKSALNTNHVKNDMPILGLLNSNMANFWAIQPAPSVRNHKRGDSPLKVNSGGKNQWVKIAISREGIYRIDAALLSSIGVNISNSDVPTIKIFGKGSKDLNENVAACLHNNMVEQPIIVRTNGSGGLESIIFYGAPPYGFEYKGTSFVHYQSNFTYQNYYLLSWGGDPGLRAEPLPTPAGDVVVKPVSYTAMIFKEENLYNAYVGGSGKMWFGRNLFPAIFDTLLTNIVREGVVSYRVCLAQRSSTGGNFDVYENDNKLFSKYIPSVSLKNYQDGYWDIGAASIPANQISVDNHSKLRIEFRNNDNTAIPYFNWYEINYPKSFNAVNGQIDFFSDPNNGVAEYNINSFTGNEIIGFEVTDSQNPKLLKNIATTGGMFIFRTLIAPNYPTRFFISSNFLQPSISKTEVAGLRDDFSGADLILVTHPDLLESAKEYKDYRESHDALKVFIALTNDIYNEFACGAEDPTAIRDFLGYAFAYWSIKPRYVLLWGDGHYDYKHISGTRSINYVPPFETSQSGNVLEVIHSWTSDDYFANVAGGNYDGVVDLGVGRITVTSPDNGQWIVEKIKGYESGSAKDNWRSISTLIADDSWAGNDSNGSQHTSQSEDLSDKAIPQYIQQKKIILVEYPTENVPGGKRKPMVEEELLNVVNTSGTVLLNYVGHGNPRVWAHEEILERGTTIPKMLNADKLFFCTAATCDYGRFDMPDVRSGAEEMLHSKIGGAIGVFAATRVVTSYDNHLINKSLYNYFFTQDKKTLKYPRLGDCIFDVKQTLNGENDKKFYLLGDPAMRLLIPELSTILDTIKGISLKDNKDTIELKALEYVRMTGYIAAGSSTFTDSTFNGTAIITMLDGDEPVQVKDYDGSIHNILKFGGALNRSIAKVINGRFVAQFYIPKDISFSDYCGRLYVYAYSEDDRFAKGAERHYKVNGLAITDVNDYPDKQGPEINIFLDSRNFRYGDVVRCNPLLIVDLSDESGINSTGRGIGHRIEAWLDDESASTDISDKFNTNLENPKKGSAESYIGKLADGLHTIRVRAWDVFNNYSVSEVYFTAAC
ncbi:MAG: hypothetical protein QG635_1828, partial [Bacteroidota bacterium]|nr:hypothetical protein [Bacteroidota bacterium]